jgi:alpha-N-arabinofuranosidase
MKTSILTILLFSFLIAACNTGNEYHVSPAGDDSNPGTSEEPLKTIMAAADLAQPGDIITIHEGIYRERIDPPRGGNSDKERITYQSAEGEKVVIKGSEEIKQWTNIQDDTWRAVLPNSMFGDFNPYNDLINGDWFNPMGREHHTGAVYLNGHWLTEAPVKDSVFQPAGDIAWWFSEVEEGADGNTIIWAQFRGADPNNALAEINVRQTVFYPSSRGINFLTISGLTMEHAATPWAPPTAEQIGLIGTHWSKGWIIENNTIRYSVCVGLTLGKHGDQYDNTSANTAEGYVKTIERGLEQGWSKENIGHHIVRNNEISNCEQAGIVGSLGPVFSQVYGNEIHDIHIRRLFTGAEMAGIKFHAAVDTEIRGNHIYRCNRGIWLDWMAQGTRVTQNLLHDNGPSEDLFMEVNHGPSLIDNNIMISDNSLLVNSQGAAYVHNLVSGRIRVGKGEKRLTPHLEEHGTDMAGLAPNQSGDERFYNNIFSDRADLSAYDDAVLQVWMDGNVFLNGAKPGKAEPYPVILEDYDPGIRLAHENGEWFMTINLDKEWAESQVRKEITSDVLGYVAIPNLPYVMPDGSEYRIDTDYLGNARDKDQVFPGPFDIREAGVERIRVW